MKELLKDLYDCFYTPPELSAERREVENCHQALIKALEKPERRLVTSILIMNLIRSVCLKALVSNLCCLYCSNVSIDFEDIKML